MPISFGELAAKVSLDLDRPEGPYYPGDEVQAKVLLESEKGTGAKRFRVGLWAWEQCIQEDSEGSDTTRTAFSDFVVVETLFLDRDLPPGTRQPYEVALRIPEDAFPPYHTSSIRSGWSVRAVLERNLKKDVEGEVMLPLVVPPPGLKARPVEGGAVSHPQEVEMHIWLPSLEWVEGDRVEGKLTVIPRKSFEAGEVRVQLIRHEKVHMPRFKSSSTNWLDRVSLAGKTRFQQGQMVEWTFEYPLPATGCPTRQTEATTVAYCLRASLGRRFKKDYTAEVEIDLYNGR